MSGTALLVGLGARASLGASPEAVGAAYLAGIARHLQTPLLLTRAGLPVVAAADPLLPAGAPLERRLLELLSTAVSQALGGRSPGAPVDVMLALPEPRPGVGPRLPDRVLAALPAILGERAQLGEARVFSAGRAGGIAALSQALGRLASGSAAACLWCGVDSYLTPLTLDALDAASELHVPGSRWGFIPGEAAAAALLVTPALAERAGLVPRASVRAACTSSEPDPGDVALGPALTRAARAALQALPEGERVHRVYADLDGRRERVDDVGFTLSRIAERLASPPYLLTPADRLGAVGAASAPLFAALAVVAASLGRAPGPHLLLCSTGPGALAGAALLEASVEPRER